MNEMNGKAVKKYLRYKPRTEFELIEKFGTNVLPLLDNEDFEKRQWLGKQVFAIKNYDNYHVNVFSEITSVDDLLYYLRKTSVDNIGNYVSTCTSSTKLKLILKNKKWYVNHPSEMNDKFEYESFQENDWGHKYFISFSEGNDESIAMWSMYGQPWDDGVMVSIPSKILKKWEAEIRNNMKYYIIDNDVLVEKNDPLFVDINRVVYYNEQLKSLGYNRQLNYNFANPYREKVLAGFIKDAAWKYENEYRLLIGTPSTHDAKTIIIDVPDYVISSMIITTSPRFKGVLNVVGVENIKNSRFANKLNYVYCDKCKI